VIAAGGKHNGSLNLNFFPKVNVGDFQQVFLHWFYQNRYQGVHDGVKNSRVATNCNLLPFS
jgi:hypothetical protein